MSYAGELFLIVDLCFNESRLTGVGAGHNRWVHWGGRGANELRVVGHCTDGPFVRCYEEESYEACLSELVERFRDDEGSVPSADLSLLCFARPYDRVYWSENFDHWAKESAFEFKWRILRRAPMMVGWHNVEV